MFPPKGDKYEKIKQKIFSSLKQNFFLASNKNFFLASNKIFFSLKQIKYGNIAYRP